MAEDRVFEDDKIFGEDKVMGEVIGGQEDALQEEGVDAQVYSVACPVTGEVIPLSQIPDSTFASGMMGPGVGIRPEEGQIAAPFDGEVSALFDTKHAMGLTSDDGGVEVLIHIGIDTVELRGAYITALVAPGDHVKAGQPLLEVDLSKIREAGYDTTVAVLVSNLYLFPRIRVVGYGRKEQMEPLLECGKETE